MLTSPYPPAECSRRLEEATARAGSAFPGSASSRTRRRRLYGTLGWPEVQVTRAGTSGRGSLQVYFDGAIKPASGGGTMLRGTIGLRSPKLPFLVASCVGWLAFAAAIAVGMANGAIPGGQDGLLVPAVVAVGNVAMLASAPGRVSSQAQQLLHELCDILGATATMES